MNPTHKKLKERHKMHVNVTGASILHPTVHIVREHTEPPLTVARIIKTPEAVSVRFRRTRFGDTESLEIKDPKVLQNFVGLQFLVLYETVGEHFAIEFTEVLTKHNGNCKSFLSAMATVARLDEASMVTALVDHNHSAMVFIPKVCASALVITT